MLCGKIQISQLSCAANLKSDQLKYDYNKKNVKISKQLPVLKKSTTKKSFRLIKPQKKIKIKTWINQQRFLVKIQALFLTGQKIHFDKKDWF